MFGEKFPPVYLCFKLIRWLRVKHITARFEKVAKLKYFWIKFLKLIVISLFSVHCGACVFSYLYHASSPSSLCSSLSNETCSTSAPAPTQRPSENVLYRYVNMVYWSITTLSTVGFGDVIPTTIMGKLFAIAYMMYNVVFGACLVASLTYLFISWPSPAKKFRDSHRLVSRFVERNGILKELKSEMITNLRMRMGGDLDELSEQQEVVESFPMAIRLRIQQKLFISLVQNAYLFHDFSDIQKRLFNQIVSQIRLEYFPTNSIVVLRDDITSCFYVLESGEVEYLSKNEKQVLATMTAQGDVIGEIGALRHAPQLFTIRARRPSTLLCLDCRTFLDTINSYEGVSNRIWKNIIVFYKDFEEHLNHEDYERMKPAYVKRCNVLDPNDRDGDGRTPLHVAVIRNGELESLIGAKLLIESGAEINAKDKEGNTPLMARGADSDEFTELLKKYGAVEPQNEPNDPTS